MSTFESLYLFKRNRRSKYNKYGYFLKLFESVEETRKTNVTRGKCVKTKSSKSNKILNSATLLSENNIRQRIKLISSMRNTWPVVVILKYFNHSSNQNKLGPRIKWWHNIGYIDVEDEMCWRQLWDFGDGFRCFRHQHPGCDSVGSQHPKDVIDIEILSPTQKKIVTNIYVANTDLYSQK